MTNIMPDVPEGGDLIPLEGISLTEAFDRVLRSLASDTSPLSRLDEDWLIILKASKAKEREFQDAEVYDDEHEEDLHLLKVANLFLRLEIEAKRLVACVRHPVIGDKLRLPPDGWIPEIWDDDIPPGIYSNYVRDNDFECAGPGSASIIRGALRPVFFMRTDFELWLEQTFDLTNSLLNDTSASAQAGDFRVKRSRVRQAVKRALAALWGGVLPEHLSATDRNNKIREWVKKESDDKSEGKIAPPADNTIILAIKEIREAHSQKN